MVLSFIIYMLVLYATDGNRAPDPDAISHTSRRLTVFKYVGVVCNCAEGREMLRIDESFFRRHENTPSSKMAFMCYETLLKSVDTFSTFLLSFLAEDGVVEQELDRIQVQKNIMKIKKQDEIKERIFESIRNRERRRQEQERIRLEQQVDQQEEMNDKVKKKIPDDASKNEKANQPPKVKANDDPPGDDPPGDDPPGDVPKDILPPNVKAGEEVPGAGEGNQPGDVPKDVLPPNVKAGEEVPGAGESDLKQNVG